ncbi:MAG: QueT transporter family protein [Candidatus Zixiibacteriota bacterium]
MKKIIIRDITYAGIIGALYAVMTISLAPISYGVYQIRIAEALTVLPFLFPFSIVGLFIGCLVANIFGGNGLQDILFGSLFTFIAGYFTYLCSTLKSKRLGLILAPLPPVLINAFGVSAYLYAIIGMSYFSVVMAIGVGQIVACYILGLPLLIYLKSKNIFFENRK